MAADRNADSVVSTSATGGVDEAFCEPNPCRNDGICLSSTDGSSCQCPSGFAGPACEKDIRSGWDYNLAQRCARLPHPDEDNYFEDLTDCSIPGRNWTVAVQSESALGMSCPGPSDQSFLINGPQSPVTLSWIPHEDEFGRDNWMVRLVTDLNENTHHCDRPHFTWYVLMDHAGHGGGPLPRPAELIQTVRLNYDDFTPNGQSRLMVGFSAWWHESDGVSRRHAVELALYQSPRWGDNCMADCLNGDVIISEFPQRGFVYIDGAPYGLHVARRQDVTLTIPWHEIIRDLVDRGVFDAPSRGWDAAETASVYVGHEAYNGARTSAVVAELEVTNFRVETVSGN